MIISETEIILAIAISFILGIVVGSTISFIYWRKRVLLVKSKTKTSFLKIYFTILVSIVWLILTMSEALFNGPSTSILVHIIFGGVAGVVMGPDFARFITSVRMGSINNKFETSSNGDNKE
jgi:hypothetical protein